MAIPRSSDPTTIIQNYYQFSPDWVEKLKFDIENSVAIPGVTLADMVSVAQEFTGDPIDMVVDPETHTDSDFEDEEVSRQKTAEEAAARSGSEVTRDSTSEVPTDAINQALQILAENDANQTTSEDEAIPLTDAMLEDFSEMAMSQGPYAMVMVMSLRSLRWASEFNQEAGEALEELSEETECLLGDLEDISYDSSDQGALAQAQAQATIINTKLEMIQQTSKMIQECMKTSQSIPDGDLELQTSLNDSKKRLEEFILNKM